MADCVRVTLGPSGRNAVIGRQDIPPFITNDGVTIALNIEADDETENLGVRIMREALSITDTNGGDGTTTTSVILQRIVSDLFEVIKDDGTLVKNKVDAIKLKKDLDKWCAEVIKSLKAKARPITPEDIYNVAIVSGEYPWLAKMVTEIYEKIGKDGHVTIEEGVTTGYDVYKGIEINAGYTSEYFITDSDKRQCIIESPHILVTNQKIDINSMGAIVDLIADLISREHKDLVIIAPEFSRDILTRFITTKVKTGFSTIALKLPTFDKDDVLVDIATLTEGKLIDKNIYLTYDIFAKEFKYENLGQAEKMEISESKSVIIGGKGDTSERVEQIKKTRETTSSLFDRDRLDRRIAYLSGGIALIRIGGISDNEKTYFKLKCEDAVNAVDVALKDGVIKGGGLALKEISDELPANILSDALRAPYQQIQQNNGGPLEIPDTVIDPVKITISALESACSLAGLVITTEVTTAYKREKHGTKDTDES